MLWLQQYRIKLRAKEIPFCRIERYCLDCLFACLLYNYTSDPAAIIPCQLPLLCQKYLETV